MSVPALTPTAYHLSAREILRTHEAGLWGWYSSDAFGQEQAEQVRLELLKSTYRIDPASNVSLYGAAAEVAERLGVAAPVTLYQTGGGGQMNAGLCFVPGEAHVVITGPVLGRLDAVELRALLGHELAHYRLWTEDGGSFRVADAMIESVARCSSAPPSWIQLAARHRRYTEIYADRGSLVGNGGDLHAAIRCLLKVSEGIDSPDADAYLRQVDEVLAKSTGATDAESHPEMFLRAWSMQIWLADADAFEPMLATRVQGPARLETLDLLAQVTLTRQTRELLDTFLSAPWLRSEATLAHARLFFSNFESTPAPSIDQPRTIDSATADYFSFVLIDLATSDPDLGDPGLAAAQAVADGWGFGAEFDKLARKELRLTVTAINDLRRQWPTLREKAAQTARSGE